MTELLKFRVWDKKKSQYISDEYAKAITSYGEFILG